MNVTESTAILLEHFIKNDSITSEQFQSITPKKVQPSEAEAGFVYSLLEMEKRELLVKYNYITNEGKTIVVWILKQPIIFSKQLVEIDGNLSIGISNIVNDFFEQMGDKQNFCNPLSIKADDIKILLEIVNILAERNLEKDNKIAK